MTRRLTSSLALTGLFLGLSVAAGCPAPECYSDLDCPDDEFCGTNDQCQPRTGDAGVLPDAGDDDAGDVDAGDDVDAGGDAGAADAGDDADAGTNDAGTTDAGTTDAGTTDAGGTNDGGTDDGGTAGDGG